MGRNARTILLAFLFVAAAFLADRVNSPRPGHPPWHAHTFFPLIRGRTLTGWKGLVGDPVKRSQMNDRELAAAQQDADWHMREHWSIDNDGVLSFDGKGDNLCTAEAFGDFELSLEWSIPPGGDSGIYLRGSPQVQIWDNPIGSGGLYNNKLHPSGPLVVADRQIGQWNRFHILMRGEIVTVWLNERLVVNHVPMENYWERDEPIYPRGSIELQSHGGPLRFRNIFVKRLN